MKEKKAKTKEYNHRMTIKSSELKPLIKLHGGLTGNMKKDLGLSQEEDDKTFDFYKRIEKMK